MWKYIQKLCEKYNLEFSPKTLIVDFKKAAHDGFLAAFANSNSKILQISLRATVVSENLKFEL